LNKTSRPPRRMRSILHPSKDGRFFAAGQRLSGMTALSRNAQQAAQLQNHLTDAPFRGHHQTRRGFTPLSLWRAVPPLNRWRADAPFRVCVTLTVVIIVHITRHIVILPRHNKPENLSPDLPERRLDIDYIFLVSFPGFNCHNDRVGKL